MDSYSQMENRDIRPVNLEWMIFPQVQAITFSYSHVPYACLGPN